jgi:hypothetical protein
MGLSNSKVLDAIAEISTNLAEISTKLDSNSTKLDRIDRRTALMVEAKCR